MAAADLVVILGRKASAGEVEGAGGAAQPGQGDTEVLDAVGTTLLRAAVTTRGASQGDVLAEGTLHELEELLEGRPVASGAGALEWRQPLSRYPAVRPSR
jgi:hypothetical protein